MTVPFFFFENVLFTDGMGCDGMDGTKYQKFLLVLFIVVLNTIVPKFGQVGGPDAKIQKHHLGWIFLKSY